MRLAFFSDVHANLAALNAVILDFRAEKIDRIFFLGDAVGYGPNPNECVELIDEIAEIKLMGNHDYAALGLMKTDYFNQYAAESMSWTKDSISQKAIEILSDFEITSEVDNFMLVHASPKEPDQWHYILDMDDVVENFEYFKNQICLIGHTHRPYIVTRDEEGSCSISQKEQENICDNKRYLINIGSVGQPRDSDPRSCYLICDTEKKIVRLKRIAYNLNETQKQMSKAGLPEYLIERLAVGR
ncbi:MAG: metallophosphoesterase family protein [candidate division Zixibacteria bacterium]|nr:metallophosphoesterase family protein [candidate division Zixibacteria bacterium]